MQLLVSLRRISITRERNNGERVVTPGWHTGQLFRSRRELPDFQRKPSPELWESDTLCRVPQSPPRSFRSQQHRRHGGFQWHQPAILIRYISDTNGRYVNSNLFVTCLRKKTFTAEIATTQERERKHYIVWLVPFHIHFTFVRTKFSVSVQFSRSPKRICAHCTPVKSWGWTSCHSFHSTLHQTNTAGARTSARVNGSKHALIAAISSTKPTIIFKINPIPWL